MRSNINDAYVARHPTVYLYASPVSLRTTPNRVTFSLGTIRGTRQHPLPISYDESAIIPHAKSFLPDQSTENSCWGSRWVDRTTSIGIVKLFEHELICSLQAQLNRLQHQQSISGFDLNDPFLRELLRRVSDVCDCFGPYYFHRISDDIAGLETVSVDTATGKFVGLHIDAWDQLSEADALLCANRLCINFGAQNRTFLFVNQNVTGMQAMLGLSADDIANMTKPQIGRRFLKIFPEYPVTQLMVRPGEAYLAPTGLVLHDASTKEATERVKHAAFRGHFDLKN